MLKGKVPDQSHAMKDVAYHFTNLWFAGQNRIGHWPVLLRRNARASQVGCPHYSCAKTKGGELDLRPMLTAWTNHSYRRCKRRLMRKMRPTSRAPTSRRSTAAIPATSWRRIVPSIARSGSSPRLGLSSSRPQNEQCVCRAAPRKGKKPSRKYPAFVTVRRRNRFDGPHGSK